MTATYVDSNVFLYAIGTEHRYREPCRRIVKLLGERRMHAEISVAVLQEIVHHRRRRGDSDPGARARDAARLCEAVHDLTLDDVHRTLSLIESHATLPTLDAIHAGIALRRGLEVVLSADRDFDSIPGLRRVDPSEEAAVAELVRERT